jgi:hypothetical protein
VEAAQEDAHLLDGLQVATGLGNGNTPLECLCGLGAAAKCRVGLSQVAIGGGVVRIETGDLGELVGGLGKRLRLQVALQRHFNALNKFTHGESRVCGRRRHGKEVL